jgi:hypothetical protein
MKYDAPPHPAHVDAEELPSPLRADAENQSDENHGGTFTGEAFEFLTVLHGIELDADGWPVDLTHPAETPSLQSDENEEALDRLAHKIIELFKRVYDPELLHPLLYIEKKIAEMVQASSASADLKKTIKAKTPIAVSFRKPYAKPSGMLATSAKPNPIRYQYFTLDEIVTDGYRRQLVDNIQVTVNWPANYPKDLIDALESTDLQSRYTADVETRLRTPEAQTLLVLQLSVETSNALEQFVSRTGAPEVYRQAANDCLQGKINLQTVRLQKNLRSSPVPVGQCLYLPCADEHTYGGLLIFLNEPEGQAVMVLPMKHRLEFIHGFHLLHRRILQRLPLYEQLALGDHSFAPITSYSQMHYVQRKSPLVFAAEDDVFAALQKVRVERLLSDMDTLVSTDHERFVDKLLATGVFIFQALSFLATLPLGGGGGLAVRLLASFLLGQSAAALETIRGQLADTPEEAQAHYSAGIFSAVSAIVAPLAFKLAGKALSAIGRTKVAARILKHLASTDPALGKIREAFSKIKPSRKELRGVKGEIVAKLSKGPHQAQSLIEHDARLVTKHVEGHNLVIYRGRVFRGDTRGPQEIFSKGFKLRTPAEEIRKDIHQVTGVRGGFGGDPDALGLDGRGISTSAYYYREHTGAFVYGGKKGGYTYLIDAKKLDGYHLYQNHHNARYPTQANQIQFRPTEINFGQDIPSSLILGAYDSAGVFIPNHPALKRFARQLTLEMIRRTLAGTAAVAATSTVVGSGVFANYAVDSIEVEIG